MTTTPATTPNVCVAPALVKRCREYVPYAPRAIRDPLSAVVSAAVRAFLDADIEDQTQRTVLAEFCEDQLQGRERVTNESIESALSPKALKDMDAICRQNGLTVRQLVEGCIISTLSGDMRTRAIESSFCITSDRPRRDGRPKRRVASRSRTAK